MANVRTDNNIVARSSIEEELQNAYLQSNQINRKKKKKNQDLILLENLKKGGSLHKADDDAMLLANTYNPDADPKNTKSNRRRQQQQLEQLSRENPAFTDNENEVLPKKTKAKTQKKDTDSPAVIEYENEIIPKKKKTRKKETELNESTATDDKEELTVSQLTSAPAPASPNSSQSQAAKKKKKKAVKTREKLKSEDELEKSYDDAEVEHVVEPVEEAPKPKPRKKRRAPKKPASGEEPGEAGQSDEPCVLPPECAADSDRVLQVTIHRTDKLKSDFYIAHPLVRVHVIDVDTGQYVKKQTKERRVTSFFENKNEHVDFILPIMTLPFDFKKHQSTLPIWEENIVFNENFDYLCQTSLSVVLFFEVLDFVSMRTTNRQFDNNRPDGGWHHIAWGFLRLMGANAKPKKKKVPTATLR